MKTVLSLLLSILLFTAASWYRAAVPPTISDIPDQVTQRNATLGPVNFTVGDTETSVDSLFVTAVSRDTFLVSPGNIAFGGSGAARSVTITPTTNATGTVVIEIWVSDGAESAVDTFLLKVNSPPVLNFNLPVTVAEGGSGVYTSALIHALDPDNTPDEITYEVGVDSVYYLHGVIRLNGVALPVGATFTQEDVDSNRISYLHDGSESASDFMLFRATDADGGVASDGGFTVFHLNATITPVNDAPIPHNAAFNIGIGQSLNGTLAATDPDSPGLTFSITADGTLGTATVTDSAAGTFTYVPTPGAAGADSFFFQAFDGQVFAGSPGRVLINIANQPPVVADDSAVTVERVALNDTFHATDPDLPVQPLSYAVVNAGHLGTAVVTDSASGAFTYTPAPDMFGTDTVEFTATDGLLTSAAGMFRVIIRPAVDDGDILVCDTKTKGVVLIDPSTGAQGLVASGGSLSRPVDVVVESGGQLIVLDGANGLVRVDPVTGSQSSLTPGSAFTTAPLGPTTLAVEADGSILVADGMAGVKRVHPVTGAVSVVAAGTNLNLVVGVAIDAAGVIFAGDASALAGGASAVVRIDPTTGAQSVVATGGNIKLPIGITLDANGTIFLCQPNSFVGAPPDLVERIDSATGAETIITPSDTLRVPLGIEIDAGGKLIVSNNQGDVVMSIDSATGATTTVSAGGLLQEPFGLTIVRPRPAFQADRYDIDLGAVAVGSSGGDSIVVTNTGSAPLYITSVSSDSVQFGVTPGSATVAPSASATFQVTFTPTSGDSITSGIVFVHNAFGSPSVVTVHARGIITGIDDPAGGIPKTFQLYANFPNPFNPSTALRFDLASPSAVTLKVYSLLGTEVATLLDRRPFAAGSHATAFDASGLASGVYFYEITAASPGGAVAFRSVKKMLLMR